MPLEPISIAAVASIARIGKMDEGLQKRAYGLGNGLKTGIGFVGCRPRYKPYRGKDVYAVSLNLLGAGFVPYMAGIAILLSLPGRRGASRLVFFFMVAVKRL